MVRVLEYNQEVILQFKSSFVGIEFEGLLNFIQDMYNDYKEAMSYDQPVFCKMTNLHFEDDQPFCQ